MLRRRGDKVFFCNTCTVEVEGAWVGVHRRDGHDIDNRYPDKWVGAQLFRLLTSRVRPRAIAEGMRAEMKRTHQVSPQSIEIIKAVHRILERAHDVRR